MGGLTFGSANYQDYVVYGQGQSNANYAELQQLLSTGKTMISGDKPLVVCGSETVTCKDMDEAQRKAEELAHKHSTNAYILKPVRLVAPKRDVVTTELS